MTRPKSLALAVAATLAILLPGSGTRAAVSVDPDAQRFRESMGFSTDPDTLAGYSMTATSVQKYGVPLTKAEEEDVDGRIAMQESLGPLVDFANQNSEAMGGIWLDQAVSHGHGATIALASTRETSQELLAQATALVPPGSCHGRAKSRVCRSHRSETLVHRRHRNVASSLRIGSGRRAPGTSARRAPALGLPRDRA
jgi:hypothetical protein